ncbi:protein-lysine N-methyltransferase EFM3-like [Salvia splendens]|uniref:protein-lysine N-methyltransferase EFM3-like n=1 Tax=Salvia splendens TaxID=180675 RepID=UPI001C274300|nr:protein-lysine N-methyltransferase EFM3-like [Salvia splendens]XP_042001730.1 protein-lysine N-methyltransferase EFM3-like [Salvia splendens]
MDSGEENDIVCLDESFFINDNYQIARFTFGSQILELYCLQSASTDFDLTGQMVWPGAELLNDYLSKNSDILRGCSVIELGSGVGITGILCSRFCREVVMTDHNDEVLKILTRNIELADSSKNSACSAILKSAKLEWGNSEQLDDILQRHPEGFDLVVGADICFQQASVPLLFHTVKRLLNVGLKKKCRFILGYVSRAKVMDDMVIGEASRHGLRITEVAGTRAEIRNLGGVIYEITCP